jgi:5-methylcytosine-specific restriction endonuclease McrA
LAARERKNRNVRRSRKLAAEVAGPVPASVYAEILAEGSCVYCGNRAQHVDHIVPLARGGHEAPYNLVPACQPCNSSKGARLLAEWDQVRVAYAMQASAKVAAVVLAAASEPAACVDVVVAKTRQP